VETLLAKLFLRLIGQQRFYSVMQGLQQQ